MSWDYGPMASLITSLWTLSFNMSQTRRPRAAERIAALADVLQHGHWDSDGSKLVTITAPDGRPVDVPAWIAKMLAELDQLKMAEGTHVADLADLADSADRAAMRFRN